MRKHIISWPYHKLNWKYVLFVMCPRLLPLHQGFRDVSVTPKTRQHQRSYLSYIQHIQYQPDSIWKSNKGNIWNFMAYFGFDYLSNIAIVMWIDCRSVKNGEFIRNYYFWYSDNSFAILNYMIVIFVLMNNLCHQENFNYLVTINILSPPPSPSVHGGWSDSLT